MLQDNAAVLLVIRSINCVFLDSDLPPCHSHFSDIHKLCLLFLHMPFLSTCAVTHRYNCCKRTADTACLSSTAATFFLTYFDRCMFALLTSTLNAVVMVSCLDCAFPLFASPLFLLFCHMNCVSGLCSSPFLTS